MTQIEPTRRKAARSPAPSPLSGLLDLPVLDGADLDRADRERAALAALSRGLPLRTATLTEILGGDGATCRFLSKLSEKGVVRPVRRGVWLAVGADEPESLPAAYHRLPLMRDLPGLMDQPVLAEDLAVRTGIPARRLAGMLARLGARGIVESRKDPKGRTLYWRRLVSSQVLGSGEERLLLAFPDGITDTARLAEALGWSARTARSTLDSLVERGLVETLDFPQRLASRLTREGRAWTARSRLVEKGPVAEETTRNRLIQTGDTFVLKALDGSPGMTTASLRLSLKALLMGTQAPLGPDGFPDENVLFPSKAGLNGRLQILLGGGRIERLRPGGITVLPIHHLLTPNAHLLLHWLSGVREG